MIFLAPRLRTMAKLLPLCLLPLALHGAPAAAQDAVFDAISDHLFENVLYAQAQLKISTPLLKLDDVALGTGSNSFVLKGSDGAYRLWNLQAGSQQAVIKAPAGTAFAPSSGGTTFFIGQSDGSVLLIDPHSGKTFATLPGKGGAVTALAASPDDSVLFVAHATGTVSAWPLDTRQPAWAAPVSSGAIARLSASADGKFLAIADAGGALVVLDAATGKPTALRGNLGETAAALYIAPGGQKLVAIGGNGKALSLGKRASTTDLGSLTRADIGLTGDSATVLRDGKVVELIDLESGKTKHTITELKTPAIGVIYDEAAAKVIVIDAAGTLQVFDTVTKEMVLSIFISAQGWALVDRQGRFDGSGSGLRGISWAVKKSNFPISSLTQAFSDPGMLSAVLDKDKRELRTVPGNPVEKYPMPPKAEIEPISTELAGDKPYQLMVIATDQGGGIKDVRLYHNGKIVDVGAILEQKDAEVDGKHVRVIGYNVWPVPGPNVFQAAATGSYDNPGDQAEMRQTFSGEPRKGQLNLITVGVSQYSRLPKEYQLKVAANDAGRVKSAVSTYSKALFTDIAAADLTDVKATKAQILHTLDGLKTAKPEDSVILFLSGHGVTDESDWYFLPSDATEDDSDSWISASEIRGALERSGAQRVFVIIDACYSGGTVENFYAVTSFQKRFLTNGLRSSGIQVLTATRRDQLAPESAELGAGFLTYLVDQALKGKGDVDPRDGWISSQEVAKFTYAALPELFLAQREKNPKAFRAVYGADVQQPDIYTVGADLLIAKAAQ
ncbi:caspase family protein [Dongia sp.]|uniref:caspase family protein n=1 Tax=Dongia sp. TaxID=1977262 RepID=UPI0035B01A95